MYSEKSSYAERGGISTRQKAGESGFQAGLADCFINILFHQTYVRWIDEMQNNWQGNGEIKVQLSVSYSGFWGQDGVKSVVITAFLFHFQH